MQAIRMHQTGGPDVLQVEDGPLPVPGPGMALVSVEAAGVNFIDIYQRTGQYKVPLPFTPGAELAGVVTALGPRPTDTDAADLADITVGSRVATPQATGAYAQYALVPAQRLVLVPDAIASQTAAAVMLQGMTAHYLTHSAYLLRADDACLIHAAAGGVGRLLVQLAKMRGARVIATVGNEEKAALARSAGADEVILYTQTDFETAVKDLTTGSGVAVVYDSVGKDTCEKGLRCLRRRGSMILYGQSSGAVPPLDPQILNRYGSLWLTRPTLGDYIATPADLRERARDLFTWLATGALEVRLDQTFPLAQAGAAQQYLSDRKTKGKVLLIPPA
ncbi:MAG: quinone oxidoreductase [Ktedonobacterales bacterium]|nr:quinone oxidoreductase [Ktedonobacterales bacterium]